MNYNYLFKNEIFILKVIKFLWLSILLSSFTFIFLSTNQVFDEPSNLQDIIRYKCCWPSIDQIKNQINPPGPLSFIWISYIGFFLGDDLYGYRLAVYASWLIIFCVFYVLANTPEVNRTNSALLILLSATHLPTAMSTLLTEGPALMFALTGILCLILITRIKNSSKIRLSILTLSFGLCIGASIISRQYYLCIIPAIFITTLQLFLKAVIDKQKLMAVSIGLGISLIPILTLYVIWGGISSPSIREAGISYKTAYSTLGVNLERPFTAALYLGIYSLPFTSYLSFKKIFTLFNLVLIFTIFTASTILFMYGFYPFGLIATETPSGPVLSFVKLIGIFTSNFIGDIAYISLVSIGALGIYSLFQTIRTNFDLICQKPICILSLLTLILFCVEQFAIGGNIPFYDRYILQVIPFLAIFLGGLNIKFGFIQIAYVSTAIIIGQVMLWRHLYLN